MANVLGSQGPDSYRGSAVADTFTLLGGNDVVLGLEGEDVI